MLWVSGVAGGVAGDRRVGVVVVGTHVDEAVAGGGMTVSLGRERAGGLECAVCLLTVCGCFGCVGADGASGAPDEGGARAGVE